MNSAPDTPRSAANREAWFYNDQGLSQGPCTAAEMRSLLQHGQLQPDSLVWTPDQATWLPLATCRPPWSQLPPTSSTPAPQPTTPHAAIPDRQPAPAPDPAHAAPRLKPQAPSQPEPTPKKSGFFSKLFGKR